MCAGGGGGGGGGAKLGLPSYMPRSDNWCLTTNKSYIISSDEDPGLRIESFSTVKNVVYPQTKTRVITRKKSYNAGRNI